MKTNEVNELTVEPRGGPCLPQERLPVYYRVRAHGGWLSYPARWLGGFGGWGLVEYWEPRTNRLETAEVRIEALLPRLEAEGVNLPRRKPLFVSDAEAERYADMQGLVNGSPLTIRSDATVLR